MRLDFARGRTTQEPRSCSSFLPGTNRRALLGPLAPRQRGHRDAVPLPGEEKPRVHAGAGWDGSDGRPPSLSRDTAVPSPDLPGFICRGLLNAHAHRSSSLNTNPRESACETLWKNTPIFLIKPPGGCQICMPGFGDTSPGPTGTSKMLNSCEKQTVPSKTPSSPTATPKFVGPLAKRASKPCRAEPRDGADGSLREEGKELLVPGRESRETGERYK